MVEKKVDKKVVKDRVLTHIRAGLNYTETKKKLEEEDINYPGLSKTYYTWKEEIFPSEKMDKALDRAHNRRLEQEKGEKGKLRANKWTTKKQKEADESKLAELINQAVYHGTFKFCRNRELKLEDVKEINLGGGIVASVMYFLPDLNLDHPAIVLTTRAILFYIRFKTICSTVREKTDEIAQKAKDLLSGVKGEWQREAVK